MTCASNAGGEANVKWERESINEKREMLNVMGDELKDVGSG